MRLGFAWDKVPLGALPDREIAALLGCTPQAVYYARRMRGVPSPNRPIRPPVDARSLAPVVGTASDRVIAEAHGLTAGQVARARRKLGIPAKRLDWRRLRHRLGTIPDHALAKELGVDWSGVSELRRKLGIAAWTERRTCPCGTQFSAKHMRQRFCHHRCQRYHWQLTNRAGMTAAAADCAIAVWALKRTLKTYGVKNGLE